MPGNGRRSRRGIRVLIDIVVGALLGSAAAAMALDHLRWWAVRAYRDLHDVGPERHCVHQGAKPGTHSVAMPYVSASLMLLSGVRSAYIHIIMHPLTSQPTRLHSLPLCAAPLRPQYRRRSRKRPSLL